MFWTLKSWCIKSWDRIVIKTQEYQIGNELIYDIISSIIDTEVKLIKLRYYHKKKRKGSVPIYSKEIKNKQE